MQEINHKKGKIYYSMGEVAEMFDVNASLLRFWEQEFDILKPHRNKKGNRLFTPEDVDNIRIIYHLLKERKMKIEVARKYIKDYRKEVDRDAEITERLMNIRAVLLEIKQDLLYEGQVVDDSVEDDSYDSAPLPVQENQVLPKASKKKALPSLKKADKAESDTPAKTNGVEITIVEQTVEVSVEDISADSKPPFEEQVLFEVAVPLELVQDSVADDTQDGFQSAKAAFMGFENPIEEIVQEQEEKPRPQVIEQTLF